MQYKRMHWKEGEIVLQLLFVVWMVLWGPQSVQKQDAPAAFKRLKVL